MADCGASRLLAAALNAPASGNGGIGRSRAPRRVWWAAIAVAVTMWSCAGIDKQKIAIAEMKWDLAPAAIQIHLESDPDLNEFDGRRHTLLLAVCQTPDPNFFLVQLSNQSAIGRLLETGQGVPTMLSGFNRFVISPGQKDTLGMDRAQGAQYVGIVAGYYDLDPQGAARLFAFPAVMHKKGFFSKKYTAVPQPIKIDLKLGAKEIAEATREPPALDGGKLIPVPGEQNGMIPINVSGIQQAQLVSVPTVMALPHSGGN
jgi:predicted component of type VI protein secretion system